MIEDRKFLRIKRQFCRDLALGRLKTEAAVMCLTLLDRVQYDNGTCTTSIQEAARILKCGRKKAKNAFINARDLGHIEYQWPSQGEHNFEVFLKFYYPVYPRKEQVNPSREQVRGQDDSPSILANSSLQRDKLRNKSGGPNIIQCNNNAIKKNTIKDNSGLSFFKISVPDELIRKYSPERVRHFIEFLEFDYKDHPPDNPIGLLIKALEKKYVPSEEFFKYKKENDFGKPAKTRGGRIHSIGEILKNYEEKNNGQV